jgi:hypothetical protein
MLDRHRLDVRVLHQAELVLEVDRARPILTGFRPLMAKTYTQANWWALMNLSMGGV